MIVVHTAYAGTGQRPWVARILGESTTFGMERAFVEPYRDFADAHISRTGRFSGLRLEWLLGEGIYEVCDWTRRGSRRRFVRVEGGQMTEIEREEVIEWICKNAR